MDDKVTEQLSATAERLATAAEALDRVLGRLDAQQEALNAKVDRIVAAVEESEVVAGADCGGDCVCANSELKQRVAELQKSNGKLEKSNSELQAQAARLQRKTLSPMVTSLLAKEDAAGEKFEAATLEKALQGLTVDQRIAVKAEMARAGMIE